MWTIRERVDFFLWKLNLSYNLLLRLELLLSRGSSRSNGRYRNESHFVWIWNVNGILSEVLSRQQKSLARSVSCYCRREPAFLIISLAWPDCDGLLFPHSPTSSVWLRGTGSAGLGHSEGPDLGPQVSTPSHHHRTITISISHHHRNISITTSYHQLYTILPWSIVPGHWQVYWHHQRLVWSQPDFV